MPETVGLFASIGIRKGQPFEPDAAGSDFDRCGRDRKRGGARPPVGAARSARAVLSRPQVADRLRRKQHLFADGAERLLDARTMFLYYATGISPAMANAKPGTGSAYAAVFLDLRDARSTAARPTSHTARTRPAKQFWAFTAYDNQTRSLLETDQKTRGRRQQRARPEGQKPDGSFTVWFAPAAPKGDESNWVQTRPGKGCNALLRLYAPLSRGSTRRGSPAISSGWTEAAIGR